MAKRKTFTKWTEEEIQFIIKNYKIRGLIWCSQNLPTKSYSAIQTKANRMKIAKKWPMQENYNIHRKFWSSFLGRVKKDNRDINAAKNILGNDRFVLYENKILTSEESLKTVN